MKALSLFSGIGGFDLALNRLGIEIIGACEIDEYARRIYAKHFPDVPIHEDATKIDPADLPEFDILVGGFPCQAFSLAGKRRGFEDTRGTLFFEIARIAQEKRPRYLLLENVKGLLSHERGSTIRTIFQTLDELGYDTQARIVNSKDFVPQNRERIFIIGHLREESRPKVFPFGENDKIPNGKKSPSVRTLTGGGHSGGLHSDMTLVVCDEGQFKSREVAQGINASMHKGSARHRERTLVKLIDGAEAERVYDPDGIVRTIKGGGGMGAKTGLYMMSNTKGNIKERYQKRDSTWTLDCTSSYMGVEDGTKIRRLTPTECERLQGFPDGWTEGISDTQRYKCLGNAVTVPVVEWIISSLVNKSDNQIHAKDDSSQYVTTG